MSQIINIPLENGKPVPHFDMQAVLEGVTYTLSFRWNVVDGAWRMDVYDEPGVVQLKAGLKLVANWPLNAYTASRQPPGAFVVVDSSGRGLDPELEDLGVRCKLMYFSAAELGL